MMSKWSLTPPRLSLVRNSLGGWQAGGLKEGPALIQQGWLRLICSYTCGLAHRSPAKGPPATPALVGSSFLAPRPRNCL